jgi:hypothetical protein
MNLTSKNAIKLVLGILSAVTVFHFCIILKLIPYNIAWGGRLQNDIEMYVFETISILINLFLMMILLMKGNYIQFKFSDKTIKIILWIFIGIFGLNTIGNLFAKTDFEKIFTGITFILALLLWLVVKNKTNDSL